MAYDPEIDLSKTFFPTVLKASELLSMRHGVLDVHDDLNQVIAVQDTAMPPMSLNLLRLVTGRAKMRYDLENRFGKPFRRNISAIIELKWE